MADFAGGCAFPPKYQGGTEGIPFFKVSDMNTEGNEVWLSTAVNRVTEEVLAQTKARVHPTGTVVFAKVGAALATEKRRLLAQPSAFDNNVMGLIAKPGVLPEYLYNFMLTVRLGAFAQPGAVPSVNQSHLRQIALELPPLQVQERIVEIVGVVDDQINALNMEAGALKDVYRAATSLLWYTAEGDEAETRLLGDVMHLDIARVPMKAGATYHLAGVLNAGKGLVDKDAFDGADTEYTAMNVLRENQVVMRKLTAWEGPITVVPAEFDGFVASNEFPTFTLTPDIAPGWMKHVCRTPRLWAEMQSRVVGTVQRRKRLNPDQLLSVALPVPSRPDQEQIAEALEAIEEQIVVIRAEATRLQHARAGLLSGLLDRTIDIESAELLEV
ncbi:restriction endonuclease subunit S [Rhodococcus sp. AH-ZY2]|uniref:restriction endonuclease subunit S n=1 Tax=Rhodococcus sp. AH-ZY2 TaxID=3047468 RepID=UPI0027DF27C0|nr:restriction endonuclease subunit S [Rhodococcus sp. AH-ZY2]WML66170.1 restriction endonuclease subunit S [Rhodococcus sp. AH-ZY2]